MDRVGEIIASNPSIVLNNDYLFFSLMKAFSGCNYKPEKWNKFEAMLLNHPVLSKVLLLFCGRIFILNCYFLFIYRISDHNQFIWQ
jgi:hypothetical protein